jgi:YHS domain-containing protein
MMNFFTRVVRFLFWLLVVSWSVWLLRRFVSWLLRKAATASQQSAEAANAAQTTEVARRLVRDPVCGMHIDETLSIPLREEGALVHFCSTACRDKYAVSAQKMAANG